MTRLKEKYSQKIVPSLQSRLGRANPYAVPRLKSVVVSMGVKNSHLDRKKLEEALKHLEAITGQKPKITKARNSIAGFKLREGMELGCCVTLRGSRMYEFVDRLISIALPRVRDFRGLNPKGFDGRGNYNMGLSEQLVFPEINADKVSNLQGMNIAVVTTATNDTDSFALLEELGFPFSRK